MSEPAKSLLVVDDDKDLCRMLEKFLTGKGFAVDLAYDGEAAIRSVSGNRYDLIILDIMMPGIDGYEVCQRLKTQREYNPIPILMLSAKGTEQDRIVGFKTGADAYVTKPFDIMGLVATINETIDRRRQSLEKYGLRNKIKFEFESRFSYLEKVNDLIGRLFAHTELSPDEIWELKLAMHELGINAIEHGNKKNPDKIVRIECTIFEERLEFIVEDEGEGFELDRVPDPTDDDGMQRDRGRGIYLVSKLVDDIEYENNGSRVRMVRFFNSPRPWRDK
jgi:two-component system, OmpR family, response regulator